MNREHAIRVLAGPFGTDTDTKDITAVLDAYTHQLAEDIRAFPEGDFAPGYTRGMLKAADLIDPLHQET